jgi:hypothetical protein
MRFAEVLMPRIANGIPYDWKISHSRAENFELELRPTLLSRRPLTVRLLAYTNHADMEVIEKRLTRFLRTRLALWTL